MPTARALWSCRLTMLLLAAIVGTSLTARADSDMESKVKAAYIYNFVKFVKWPAGSGGGESGPFTVCTVSPDHLNSDLEDTVRAKTIGSRLFAIRRLSKKDGDGRGCEVIFFSGRDAAKAATQILPSVRPGILTIFDDDTGSVVPGTGIITFVLEAKRVRFVIDNRAAERANLIISSKLLALAARVEQ